MTEQIAVIHAGPAAETLRMLVAALHCVGVRENYFMGDLIDTLRVDEDFPLEIKSMSIELLYGQYFHRQLADKLVYTVDPELPDAASEFLSATAKVSEVVATHLHDTLVAQGQYDENGNFPYEYHGFDGKLIFLRHL